jgi:putative membrane protein
LGARGKSKSSPPEKNSEVAAGQLAQSKASDPKVKDFGAMMVKDHSSANAQLKALAAEKNVALPNRPSVSQEAGKVKLEALSGSAFDSSYVKGQIRAHKSTLALLNKEISAGQDADANAFAQKLQPTVQSHLTAIDEIADSLNIKH